MNILRVAHVEPDRNAAIGVLGLLDDGASSFGEGVNVAIRGVPPGGGESFGDNVQGGYQKAEEEDSPDGLRPG